MQRALVTGDLPTFLAIYQSDRIVSQSNLFQLATSGCNIEMCRIIIEAASAKGERLPEKCLAPCRNATPEFYDFITSMGIGLPDKFVEVACAFDLRMVQYAEAHSQAEVNLDECFTYLLVGGDIDVYRHLAAHPDFTPAIRQKLLQRCRALGRVELLGAITRDELVSR